MKAQTKLQKRLRRQQMRSLEKQRMQKEQMQTYGLPGTESFIVKPPKAVPLPTFCPDKTQFPFEHKYLESKHMCSASPKEDGFIMSRSDALQLIRETYPGFKQITDKLKVTDWQGAKKCYHHKGLGVKPELSRKQLREIREDGLVTYVRKGRKLPSIKHVHDIQDSIKRICDLQGTRHKDAKHYGKNTGETLTIMYYNEDTRQICLFNKSSGDLITADKFNKNYFRKTVDAAQVGKSPSDTTKPENEK